MQSWNPRPYQITAAQHALYNPGAALFLEVGLGKTTVSLAVIDALRGEKQIKGTLVIAPLRVCYSVWPKEVAKWSEFAHLSVGILHGANKVKVLAERHDIYCINPEGLAWLFGALLATEAPWPFDNLIVDESSKFKNTGTQRSKLLTGVMPRFKRALLLTGTPTANRLEDIFGQVKLIDGGKRLGKFVTHFRREYFNEARHKMGFSVWTPRADTADRIKAKVQDICLYMSQADHLTMPERIDNRIEVELPEGVRADYKKIAKNFFATIGGERVSAAHAGAAQQKLRQIVGGHVYGEEGTVDIHAAKLDALDDLVDESAGEPLLVAVSFLHEAQAIQKMLKKKFGIDAPYLGGGISAIHSDAVAAQWNAGELPVLIAHPASVAHGLNLQAGGHTVVWYTLTWSLEEYIQLNGRVYRQGQERSVIIHHIIAADTVDDDVLAALTTKGVTQQSFLNALKERQNGK